LYNQTVQPTETSMAAAWYSQPEGMAPWHVPSNVLSSLRASFDKENRSTYVSYCSSTATLRNPLVILLILDSLYFYWFISCYFHVDERPSHDWKSNLKMIIFVPLQVNIFVSLTCKQQNIFISIAMSMKAVLMLRFYHDTRR
jgi:hypothetical protein